MTPEAIHILLVEDNPGDVVLFKKLIREGVEWECDVACASQLSEAIEKLHSGLFDIVMLDLSLPDSHGLDTLAQLKTFRPNTSIIVLTGLQDEAAGLEAVRAGAQDYLIKGQINGPLLQRSIRYAIERGKLRQELQDAAAHIKTLTGMLPICADCKKIRDDKGYWSRVEDYVSGHSDAVFSHGICPDCAERVLAEFRKNNVAH